MSMSKLLAGVGKETWSRFLWAGSVFHNHVWDDTVVMGLISHNEQASLDQVEEVTG